MTSTKHQAKSLTKNVSSFAHDAAQMASEFGGQAVEMGRTAADVGMDAASNVAANVASAVTQLAHSLSDTLSDLSDTLSDKVPVVHKRRSRKPLIIAVLVAAAVAFFAVRAKRSTSAAEPATNSEPDSGPRATPTAAMAS
jgi:hypothetical protein